MHTIPRPRENNINSEDMEEIIGFLITFGDNAKLWLAKTSREKSLYSLRPSEIANKYKANERTEQTVIFIAYRLVNWNWVSRMNVCVKECLCIVFFLAAIS